MGMYDKNISEEKIKSLEFAEASREEKWSYPSFVLKLFHGKVDGKLIFPFPEYPKEEAKQADEYIKRLEIYLKENLDPEQVDKTGIIPDNVIKGLAELGVFALKIPKEYGGQGFSHTTYNRIVHLIASYCGSTAVLVSAHQSIGVPNPLLTFGTDEQKKKYLPRFGQGAISGFALTEPGAGSDPRLMKTIAVPAEDGNSYIINGEKLWCTNGNIADILIIMAQTPPKIIKGKERKQITAFIVETNTPGFEVVHRCSFMGLHGIQNGIIRFKDMKVPKENIICGEGEGLKLAFVTLNTGRLTVPSAISGMSKWCLKVAREWANEREQWGTNIGKHEAVQKKLSFIANHTFAIDAISSLTSRIADKHKLDIRLEAAMSKLFSTEWGWLIADETMQIRGGRGYENSESLRSRGVKDYPIERVLRDTRVNRIIEGTTEIMRLFIAREALDPHLQKIKPLITERTSIIEKIKAVFSFVFYYAIWYPKQWMPYLGFKRIAKLPKPLRTHMCYVNKITKRLARNIFLSMMVYQKKLEAKQNLLASFVDIGTELFVMSAVCSYASHLAKHENKPNAVDLADGFCREAKIRIKTNFKQVCCNNDKQNKVIAKKVLDNQFQWLENDII